jgi:hypothetical protein
LRSGFLGRFPFLTSGPVLRLGDGLAASLAAEVAEDWTPGPLGYEVDPLQPAGLEGVRCVLAEVTVHFHVVELPRRASGRRLRPGSPFRTVVYRTGVGRDPHPFYLAGER